MMTTQMLDEYARRPKRAAEADGLNDILGGVSMIAIIAMQYVGALSRETIEGHNFWMKPAFLIWHAIWILSIIGMFAVIAGSKRKVQTLREEYVYPRLGYVVQSAALTTRRKLVLVAVSVTAMFFTAIVSRNMYQTSGTFPTTNGGLLVLLLGAITTVSYLLYFAKLGIVRYLALASVAIVATMGLSAAHMADMAAITGFTLIMAVSSIVSGTITFTRLLRTPVITDEEGE